MINKWPFVSLIIACALFGQAAITSAAERPCRADIEKFCADVSDCKNRRTEEYLIAVDRVRKGVTFLTT